MVAYNTFDDGAFYQGTSTASGCSAGPAVVVGNLGASDPDPSSCPATVNKNNVFQDSSAVYWSRHGGCDNNTWIVGIRGATNSLGISSDKIHLTGRSRAIGAGETTYCTKYTRARGHRR